tara:strand:+ start:113 stop:583 length:471 start_codon:yes stop_codon:yes gene_type:complete
LQKKPQLKIEVDESAICTLSFDDCLEYDNQYGKSYLYTFNVDGVEKVHWASDNAHKTLKECNKGDMVKISHVRKSDGGTMYIVDLIGSTQDNKKEVKKTDTDLSIKWGMAFNNSSRLVANIMDITPKQKVLLIKEIMPEMFEIACNMPNDKEDLFE